jgi:hypothetical protein
MEYIFIRKRKKRSLSTQVVLYTFELGKPVKYDDVWVLYIQKIFSDLKNLMTSLMDSAEYHEVTFHISTIRLLTIIFQFPITNKAFSKGLILNFCFLLTFRIHLWITNKNMKQGFLSLLFKQEYI